MKDLGTIEARRYLDGVNDSSAAIREITCTECNRLLMIVSKDHREAYRIRCGNCGTSHIYNVFPVGFPTLAEDEDEFEEEDDFDEEGDEDDPEAVPIWCRFFRKIQTAKRSDKHKHEKRSRR